MTHTLIHHGTLIDGKGGDPIPDGAVLIEGSRILAAGKAADIALPAAEILEIDAADGFILPGLIDAHVHMILRYDILERINTPFSYTFYKAIEHMRLTLEAGVTSVRDMAGMDLGMKKALEDGLISGPRAKICLQLLSMTGGHNDTWQPSGLNIPFFTPHTGLPDPVCDGIDDVRKKTREMLRAGADFIKVCVTGGVSSPTDRPEYIQFSSDELQAIVTEAAYHGGKKVSAHAQGVDGIKHALRAGVQTIEHGNELDEEAVEMMVRQGVFLVPTISAPAHTLAQPGIPDTIRRKAQAVLDTQKEGLALAIAAGVRIAMGTDCGVSPHGTNLRELGLMCDAGMTPMQALESATRVAAECLEWEDRLGTLEPGKLADIVITKTDPLADIRSLEEPRNIVLVMQDGRTIKDIRQ